jgi:hypothetical protein
MRRRVAHVAFDLHARREGSDRVDDDDVDGTGAHECLDDLQCLLAKFRLRQQKIIEVHAQALGIVHVQRVLGIDKGRQTAVALRLGDDLQTDGRLTGRLRAIDLDDPTARYAADADGRVQRQTSCRDRIHLDGIRIVESHDGALAERLLDLVDGQLRCLGLCFGNGCALHTLGFSAHDRYGLLMISVLWSDGVGT